MKHKVRRGGKGRERRFAREDLQRLVQDRPALTPLYEFWHQCREADDDGSGQVQRGERPAAGDGLFWQVGEGSLFLYSPQRVVKLLKREGVRDV